MGMNDVINKLDAVKNIAENVTFAMHESGISIRGLASAIKVPASTVQSLISGENEARVTTVALVAELFHVQTDDLMKRPSEFKRIIKIKAMAGC